MTRCPDQILGCIVGGAIGDAIGGAGERSRLAISDDTQLTLATCEAMLVARPPTPEQVATTFVRWFLEGRLSGLGSSTLKALRDLSAGSHWALSGAVGERSAGNGAAMRAAPLAYALDPDDRGDRAVIRDICRITHRNDEAYIGALSVIRAIQADRPPSLSSLAAIAMALPDSRVRDQLLSIAQMSEGAAIASVAERFGSSGFVAETVPLALFAACQMPTAGLEGIMAELVVVGGDMDTI